MTSARRLALPRPLHLIVVLAALATVLAACGSSPTLRRSSEICSEPRLLPAGTSSHSFTSFGSEHRYELYVPPGYDGTYSSYRCS
ncbi:MAG: hypothetical protein EON52_19180, partial [Actinomycetales bacterium]